MTFGGRVFSHEDHELLERILEQVTTNTQALADLQASVAALQAAQGNVPADISAGVETEVSNVNAVTTALGGTPPAATTPAPAAAPAAGFAPREARRGARSEQTARRSCYPEGRR